MKCKHYINLFSILDVKIKCIFISILYRPSSVSYISIFRFSQVFLDISLFGNDIIVDLIIYDDEVILD